MASGDIALQRSGCVEKEELYNNKEEEGREKQQVEGRQLKKIKLQPGEWTNPEVTGHLQRAGEEAANPRISCHLLNVQSMDSEGGGRRSWRVAQQPVKQPAAQLASTSRSQPPICE